MIQALEAVLRIEVVQPVFKRVLDIAAAIKNLVVAARAMHVVAQQRHHVIDHLLVAREDDVRTSGVISEALLLDSLAMAPAAAIFLQDLAVLFQVRRNTDAGQSSA